MDKKEDKTILVEAVGRIGYYGDQRRYPVGHPKSRPFYVKENEFSDSSKKIAPGFNGWMRKVGSTKKEAMPEAKERKPDEVFKDITKESKEVI